MQPLYISHDCAILGMAMETEVTGTTDPAMEVGVQVEVTALEVPLEVFQAEVQPLVVPVQHLDMEVPVEDKKIPDIRPTQLLNCQWNSSGIDGCQVMKYQSSQSYKV